MESRHTGAMQVASTICLLAGLWFFVSPWVYGAAGNPNAWNSWIVGAVIVILAAFRLGYPAGTVAFSWINCILGIWAFISPWIYGYTGNSGRFINSLCVGVVVFICAISSATTTHRTQHPLPTRS